MPQIFRFILILALSLFYSCAHSEKEESEKDPDKLAELYYTQGTQELVEKNYTQALTLLLKANDLRPKDSKTLNNLSMCYYFKNRVDLALKYVLLALEMDKDNFDARNNYASLLFEKGDYENASKEYQLVNQSLTYEHQYRVLFNLGLIELRTGNPKKAREYFELSLKEKEDYCPSLFQIGILEYKNKQYKKAQEKFHSATLGVCYQWPAATYYQGLGYEKLQNFEKAKEKFQDVLGRFPSTKYASYAREKLEKIEKWESKEESTSELELEEF